MTIVHFVVLLAGIVLLVISCSRPQSRKARTDELTLEQRVQSLEQSLNAEKPKYTEEELRQQFRADLAEIQRLGLVDLARQDFGSRVPNATVTKWQIGFFVDTNTVWCDMRYTLPGNEEILQKEFGYTRRAGIKLVTNWNLIWEPEPKR